LRVVSYIALAFIAICFTLYSSNLKPLGIQLGKYVINVFDKPLIESVQDRNKAFEDHLKGNRERATGNREIPIIKIRGFVQGRIFSCAARLEKNVFIFFHK
jgi:hypothetical protein